MPEQSSETLLDREDKTTNDSDLGLTPVRVVSLAPGRIHTEVNDPTHSQALFDITGAAGV